MHARRTRGAARRRGVVLVLILAMLGLLALIGVTFVTFSGQAQIAARNTALASANPDPEAYVDFALDQLINDTGNPASAIRGHSLKRDMYGRDYFYDPLLNGPRPFQDIHLSALPPPLNTPMRVTNVTTAVTNAGSHVSLPHYQIQTNIPTNFHSDSTQADCIQNVPSLYNANFTGCVLKLSQWVLYNNDNYSPDHQVLTTDRMTQTFEVVSDDYSGQYHVLGLTFADTATASPGTAFVQPDSAAPNGYSVPNGESVWNIFSIDGRYMRAFNGSGLGQVTVYDSYGYNRPYSAYGNFLYNSVLPQAPNSTSLPYYSPSNPGIFQTQGYNDPNTPRQVAYNVSPFLQSMQMDEDYDAADNENWFLALRSADGSVNIPSFHRPGNIVYNPNNSAQNDWALATRDAQAKFLRPRKVDHPQSGNTFPDLIPDPNTGQITYDVDNDGDGVTDSVWVDLGYPVQRDTSGKLYKPLFAFMVQGLNGRLPLNTAGNLNQRAPLAQTFTGVPGGPDPYIIPAGAMVRTQNANGSLSVAPGHVSHLGYSVNEINPEYALTPSSSGTPAPLGGQNYLQVLLQGSYDTTTKQVVEGRFGEGGVMVASNGTAFPRAGRSYMPDQTYPATNPKRDEFDSNFDGMDFYPGLDASGNTQAEQGDLLDPVGRVLLPSERYRRFVTPVDLSGNGRVMPYNTPPAGVYDYGLGFDKQARVGHYLYYRPPGVSNRPTDGYDFTTTPPKPIGLLTDLTKTPDVSYTTLNKLHGYESLRDPAGSSRNLFAAMPTDVVGSGDPLPGLKIPTFSARVNSNDPTWNATTGIDLTLTNGMFVDGSLALQSADQMNLYAKTSYDNMFGFGVQEYLNRAGDIDSTSLDSRLSKLLPDIFVNDTNARMKWGFFSIDSWDTNSWAAPTASFYNSGTGIYQFGTPSNSSTLTDNTNITSNNAVQFPATGNLPSLMHGGRRINLNLPLPVSDSSSEPVRQKYVRELYQMMKCVLHPPDGASASAQELAALGQYAVNIVDFRDPDATMTKFLNYDITYTDPTSTMQVDGAFTPTGTAGTPVSIHSPNDVMLPTDRTKPNPAPVAQWGMEYNPIGITEVLAFQYTRKDASTKKPTPTPRMYVELVNTLTKDNYHDTTGTGNGTASNLDLNGWGFIITRDNPTDLTTPDYNTPGTTAVVERPNVATGQLTTNTIANYFVPLAGSGMGASAVTAPLATPIPALDSGGGNKYYVMGNVRPDGTSEPQADPTGVTSPAVLSTSLIGQIPLSVYTPPANKKPATQSDYFWLHLLRPANPNNPASEKVVVDSFRFPYLVDNGWVDATDPNNETVTKGTNALYSVRRFQPYRGGHFVPHADESGSPYGFSEQTSPAQKADAGYKGFYNAFTKGSPQKPTPQITAQFFHTLGVDDGAENWDYFPFQDRDFQSAAELLLVPACPPGLFTKLFVELPNPLPFGVDTAATSAGKPKTGDLPPPSNSDPRVKYYYAPPLDTVPGLGLTAPAPADKNIVPAKTLTSGTPPISADYAFNGTGVSNMPDPVVFPYLPEAFFYSTGSKSGWYKILEFVEVPSTSFGYIGPVSAGQNADWARQDLRPGLLNLNLITDEEVFFGLIDDVRLNVTSAFSSPTSSPTVPLAAAYFGNGNYGYYGYNLPDPTASNSNPIGVPGFPRYATAVYPNGVPSYTAPAVAIAVDSSTSPPTVADRGFPATVVPPLNRFTPASAMKAAWADFLKLRDGGSGVVYSPFSTSPYAAVWGNPSSPSALPSHPYRSLANRSFGAVPVLGLDINDTVLRPARLPAYGNLATRMDTLPTPHIPPRRLFQIPDAEVGPADGTGTTPYNVVGTTTAYSRFANSPAGESPPPLVYPQATLGSGQVLWTAGDHSFLSNTDASLFLNNSAPAATTVYTNAYLGAGTVSGAGGTQDHRWHPYFRTEMLSKVMNQTTIRSHQYAVWLTVGFFEVTKEGNKQLYNSYDPNTGASLAVDQLGNELNADQGKNARYRYYFLVDRTKATGFNPQEPGDFRDLIAFRRRIE